jgi:hypothetical protein
VSISGLMMFNVTKDTGGDSLLRNKWTSYQKARLNCSLSGAFPSYFDVIRKSLLEPCSWQGVQLSIKI